MKLGRREHGVTDPWHEEISGIRLARFIGRPRLVRACGRFAVAPRGRNSRCRSADRRAVYHGHWKRRRARDPNRCRSTPGDESGERCYRAVNRSMSATINSSLPRRFPRRCTYICPRRNFGSLLTTSICQRRRRTLFVTSVASETSSFSRLDSRSFQRWRTKVQRGECSSRQLQLCWRHTCSTPITTVVCTRPDSQQRRA